jgi:trehalose 6-phosphate phosphatase
MSLRPSLVEAVESFAARTPVLVASDFDGVLAPFESDPEKVRPLPGAMETLRDLAAAPGVHVAVVSGRDLDTLARLTGVPQDDPIALIASHGAESSCAAVREAMEAAAMTPDDERRLEALTAAVTELVRERHPQVRVEHKAAAIVVHTRGLPPEIASPALSEARTVALTHEGVRVLRGKSVLEMSVSHADKGSALAAYGRHVGAAARLYLGDDVTDEDVFVRFTRDGDVTVKVGDGSTAARHRVADEAAAAELLATLATMLRGR